MKKAQKITSILLTFLSVISLASCGNNAISEISTVEASEVQNVSSDNKENEKPADNVPVIPETEVNGAETINNTDASDPIQDRVYALLNDMSTRDKLSQMMIVALRSDSNNSKTVTALTPEYTDIIRKYDFGGIILFTGNIKDAAQTVTLTRDAQSAAKSSENKIPMFICVDQEGGIVNRISYASVMPGNMALAATGDTAFTKEAASIIGTEIRALGFNTDFSPVSDVNNNPENPIIGVRSFSDDPYTVSANVTAYMSGLNETGTIASLKHFPGHGNVGEDSHTGLPSSPLTIEELKNCELIPFQAGIDSGAEMIMTAHIEYPNIEKSVYVSKKDGKEICLPATLSRTIITDLLRKDMGYNGLIITDALDMGAIADNFDRIDAAKLAINAGVDILLCPVNIYKEGNKNTFQDIEAYISSLEKCVENGEISEDRLNESVSRILKLKLEKGILDGNAEISYEEQMNNVYASVGSPDHHTREWAITQSAMTLLKNDGNVLPFDGNGNGRTLILIPSEKRRPSVEYALGRLVMEGNASAANATVICYTGLSIYNKELQNAIKSSSNVLILSQSTEKCPILEEIIKNVHQTEGRRVVLISLNLPYDAALYDVDAIICAYNAYGNAKDFVGNGPFNLNVAVSICSAFGQSVPKGKLPVDLPVCTTDASGKTVFTDQIKFQRGYGITNWGA